MKNSKNINCNYINRKLFSTLVIPLFLLISAVIIIGSGCSRLEGRTIYYLDADGDGWGGSVSDDFGEEYAHEIPEGYANTDEDCDDTDANIHPEAFDIPNNGIDEDCNGADATDTGTDG